jgi:hypothetical protein
VPDKERRPSAFSPDWEISTWRFNEGSVTGSGLAGDWQVRLSEKRRAPSRPEGSFFSKPFGSRPSTLIKEYKRSLAAKGCKNKFLIKKPGSGGEIFLSYPSGFRCNPSLEEAIQEFKRKKMKGGSGSFLCRWRYYPIDETVSKFKASA